MKDVYTPNANIPNKCVCIQVRKASRLITDFYNEVLSSSGLKITQYSLLRNIQRLGPLNMTELTEAVKLDRTTLARNLKLLDSRGLVKIARGKDSRTRQVEITKKGNEAIEKVFHLWENAQVKVNNHLGAEQISDLLKILSKLESLQSSNKN